MNWICDYCDHESTDLTEVYIGDEDEDIWVCPMCLEEIREEKREYAEWLYGKQEETKDNI